MNEYETINCEAPLLPFWLWRIQGASFDLWEPRLKGMVVLWVRSPPTVQQLLNEVTTKLKSCLNLSSLPGEVADSTFSCHKAFRPLHANSSVLGFQRAGHSSHWGRQWGGAQAHGLHFPVHDIFFHWLKQQLLFRGPCLPMMTQTVSKLWNGHLQIGRCDITSLESDFCCPDCPCDSKIEPGVEELLM